MVEAAGVPNPFGRKVPGLFENAKKNKSSFVQFFIMTGIFMFSLRSLGQKYRIYELTEDGVSLRQEQESITSRMDHIRHSLLAEAANEPTGAFAARLRLLFEGCRVLPGRVDEGIEDAMVVCLISLSSREAMVGNVA